MDLGNVQYGAIGNGSVTGETCLQGRKCRMDPYRLPVPDRVERVAAGVQFNLAQTDLGEVWAWGVNRNELGHTPGTEGDETCDKYACNPSPRKISFP